MLRERWAYLERLENKLEINKRKNSTRETCVPSTSASTVLEFRETGHLLASVRNTYSAQSGWRKEPGKVGKGLHGLVSKGERQRGTRGSLGCKPEGREELIVRRANRALKANQTTSNTFTRRKIVLSFTGKGDEQIKRHIKGVFDQFRAVPLWENLPPNHIFLEL